MTLRSINYYPEFFISLSRAEVLELEMYSNRHYDSTCKNLAKQGGIIYGMKNRISDDEAFCNIGLEWRQVDLLCKVLEASPGSKLFYSLRELLNTQSITREQVDKLSSPPDELARRIIKSLRAVEAIHEYAEEDALQIVAKVVRQ